MTADWSILLLPAQYDDRQGRASAVRSHCVVGVCDRSKGCVGVDGYLEVIEHTTCRIHTRVAIGAQETEMVRVIAHLALLETRSVILGLRQVHIPDGVRIVD